MNMMKIIIMVSIILLHTFLFLFLGNNFISCLKNEPIIKNIDVTHTITVTQTQTQTQYIIPNNKNNSIYIQIYFKKPRNIADLYPPFDEHLLFIHNYSNTEKISEFKITDTDEYFQRHLIDFYSDYIWINDDKYISDNKKTMFYRIITVRKGFNDEIDIIQSNTTTTGEILSIMSSDRYQNSLIKNYFSGNVPFVLQIMFYANTKEGLDETIYDMLLTCGKTIIDNSWIQDKYMINWVIVRCTLDNLELNMINLNDLHMTVI